MTALTSSAPVMPVTVERTVAGDALVVVRPPATTDHERLTAGTADLWRQLAALVQR